ncbi:GNAT family N-acetyltransferase [Pseudogemmobacter bohemicus]|uniref:GNAT family N-acetyltransferase n=1 Tax=Pseudogemmobacter bohemicus TaxID=2250708 RepID=UPI001E4ED85F|nr:GNAT family N-acetyltransferase [Pseudogemmobacter bohemicus]
MPEPETVPEPARILPAELADGADIAALWAPWVRDTAITFAPEPRSAAEVAALIRDRQAAGQGFFVARAPAGGLLGFATYSQFRAGAGYARSMEHTVILAPEARGLGVGRALMQAVESHARSAGAHIMVAAVSGENPGARAFHETLGYTLAGTIPGAGFKFGRYLDLLLFSKEL